MKIKVSKTGELKERRVREPTSQTKWCVSWNLNDKRDSGSPANIKGKSILNRENNCRSPKMGWVHWDWRQKNATGWSMVTAGGLGRGGVRQAEAQPYSASVQQLCRGAHALVAAGSHWSIWSTGLKWSCWHYWKIPLYHVRKTVEEPEWKQENVQEVNTFGACCRARPRWSQVGRKGKKNQEGFLNWRL